VLEKAARAMRKLPKSPAHSGLERLYYRAREVAELTGLGLRTVYGLIYTGHIPSRKIGDARLVPAAWVTAENDEAAARIAEQFRTASIPKNRYSLGYAHRAA
jgi:excisionase family DNA binding protein